MADEAVFSFSWSVWVVFHSKQTEKKSNVVRKKAQVEANLFVEHEQKTDMIHQIAYTYGINTTGWYVPVEVQTSVISHLFLSFSSFIHAFFFLLSSTPFPFASLSPLLVLSFIRLRFASLFIFFSRTPSRGKSPFRTVMVMGKQKA